MVPPQHKEEAQDERRGGGQGWEEARNRVLAPALVLAYAAAVRDATHEYLARLTEDELDRRVSFFGKESSVAEALARFVAHTAGHAGEIAAVKGMQGCKACHSEIGRTPAIVGCCQERLSVRH